MIKLNHDPVSDAIYIEIRALPSARTVEAYHNIMVDYGYDGEIVGYDVQEAIKNRHFVEQIIRLHGGDVIYNLCGEDTPEIEEVQKNTFDF
ncbi:DUF2283 domain-containing protein (plasmid) [Azospirillum sp. A29]|uniref:DUF2283 domain-containing protein n=1 Tax=Azospirillum sp. A29 TaxID=3160606 RepID=UPI0036701B95